MIKKVNNTGNAFNERYLKLDEDTLSYYRKKPKDEKEKAKVSFDLENLVEVGLVQDDDRKKTKLKKKKTKKDIPEEEDLFFRVVYEE